MRIALADGTLVATPGEPDAELIPSLLAASDVLGTGWFCGGRAGRTRKTVAVVGDGAVGLLAVLAAKQLGAERIIAMSRHVPRQKLAREFGATDIVEERGDEGVARVKELTGGFGAHSVIEAVGTQESLMQAIRSTRPGGHLGYVGVFHDVELPVADLFFSGINLHGGRPGRRFLPEFIDLIVPWIDPGKVLTSSSYSAKQRPATRRWTWQASRSFSALTHPQSTEPNSKFEPAADEPRSRRRLDRRFRRLGLYALADRVQFANGRTS